MRDPLVQKLRRQAGLTVEDAAALYELCLAPVAARDGETIVHRGPPSRFTHYIVRGWAARCEELPDGSRQITSFLLPGDFCDLHCEAVGGLDHDVVALMPVSFASISTAQLLDLEACRPAVAAALWRTALVEQATLRQWIANIGLREAEPRIAHLLCELHARLREIGEVGDHQFRFPVTQAELGEALGLTAVHTNRVLQRMRAEGMIRLEGRMLTILDPTRLSAMADFAPAYLGQCAPSPMLEITSPPLGS